MINKVKNKNRKVKNKNKQEKGITLIALIVTIIVILILAAISISMLTGENGILNQANNAVKVDEIGRAREEVELIMSEWTMLKNSEGTSLEEFLNSKKAAGEIEYITKNADGSFTVEKGEYEITVNENGTIGKAELKPLEKPDTFKETAEGLLDTESTGLDSSLKVVKFEEITNEELKRKIAKQETIIGVLEGSTTAFGTEENPVTTTVQIPIPKGFAYLEGNANDGTVIKDVTLDNEFVWIPVPEYSNFKRTNGFYSWNKWLTNTNYCEADKNGINAKVTETAKTQAEAIAMYKSVKDMKGFYMARYEAGNEGGTYNNTTEIWEGDNQKVVSKKGANVYNNIGWNNDTSDNMNVETGGAVEAAREMYNGNQNYGATSSLCYGVQWDAALNYIDSKYITNAKADGMPNCDVTSYIVDSTKQG